MLERAGLVRKRRVGRQRMVTTDVEGLRSARELLEAYEDLWRGRLERMHDLLDGPCRESISPDRSSS